MEFEIGGKAKRLRYSLNALADIEEKAGLGISVLFSEQRMGFHVIRLLLWGGLKHADPGLTVSRAGQMIEQLKVEGNTLEEVVGWIMKAIEESGIMPKGKAEENFPQPEKSGSQTKSVSSKKPAQ